MEISLITFNISASFLRPPNVPAWKDRKMSCVQVLREAEPDIIGLQEVMPDQFDYFNSCLNEFGGVAVTDTTIEDTLLRQAIERQYGLQTIPSPWEIVLFYRTDKFEQLDWGYWWISPTPDKISVGFGNIAPRVVIWVHLKHRALNQQVIIFNTHIDQRSTRPMIRYCIERITKFHQQQHPIFFLGDFNVTPTDVSYSLLINNGWQDPCLSGHDRQDATFIDGRRIDYIFYRGPGVEPRLCTQLYSPDPLRRLSDHDPVSARFNISSKLS